MRHQMIMDKIRYSISTYAAITVIHAGFVVAHYDEMMGVEVWIRLAGCHYDFFCAAITDWAPVSYIQCFNAWRVVPPSEIPNDYQCVG